LYKKTQDGPFEKVEFGNSSTQKFSNGWERDQFKPGRESKPKRIWSVSCRYGFSRQKRNGFGNEHLARSCLGLGHDFLSPIPRVAAGTIREHLSAGRVALP
jgi:hypothetical protein